MASHTGKVSQRSRQITEHRGCGTTGSRTGQRAVFRQQDRFNLASASPVQFSGEAAMRCLNLSPLVCFAYRRRRADLRHRTRAKELIWQS
jgi:hypothetical protein